MRSFSFGAAGLAAGFVLWSGSAQAQFGFDDIEFWVGSGSQQAAIVVDWTSTADANDPVLAWGFRFDGAATGEDMYLAIAAADPDFYTKFGFSSFGNVAFGFGYDLDGDGFGISDGTAFVDGIGPGTTTTADGATATDLDDVYGEGWNTAFWGYYVGTDNPYGGGSWGFASTGAGGRALSDGDWDGWSYAPGFSGSEPGVPVSATIPEPGTMALLALAGAGLLTRRRRAAKAALPVAAAALLVLPAVESYAAGTPWADTVVSYDAGSNAAPGFTNPAAALGEPTRFTSPASNFGGVTTPFNGAFDPSEIVSIGEGGSLTVQFDEPILNNPANPFGIDLLIFGNTFLGASDFSSPNPSATGVFSEGGVIEVSPDGVVWTLISGVDADGLFPTLGYRDVDGPFDNTAGVQPTDFTKPVDPSFDPVGKTLQEIVTAYDGSGGGAGVDIGAFGLESVSFVRVSNPLASGVTPEIDGFAAVVVPEPTTGTLVLGAALLALRRRRA